MVKVKYNFIDKAIEEINAEAYLVDGLSCHTLANYDGEMEHLINVELIGGYLATTEQGQVLFANTEFYKNCKKIIKNNGGKIIKKYQKTSIIDIYNFSNYSDIQVQTSPVMEEVITRGDWYSRAFSCMSRTPIYEDAEISIYSKKSSWYKHLNALEYLIFDTKKGVYEIYNTTRTLEDILKNKPWKGE